jgi:hypothetical protein
MDCSKINLKLGSNGEQVEELQTYLRACGFYNRQIDGDFGKFTEDAVKLLQNKQRNTPDGHFGPKTCGKSDLNIHVKEEDPNLSTSTNIRELFVNFRKQPCIVTCGPATLSMLFSYYNVNVAIENLKRLCKTNENGTTPGNLVAAVPQAHEDFILIEEDLKDFNQIVKHLDRNNPLCIQLQTSLSNSNTASCLGYFNSYGHYVALTGYKEASKEVKIADPSKTTKWFDWNCIKNAIDWRLKQGKIMPVKVLKKK